MERIIKAGNFRRYVREVDRGCGPQADRIIAEAAALLETKLTINYILGGPSDDYYQSKRQQRKLLKAPWSRPLLKAIHTGGNREETKPIDGPISFPPVNSNKVIVPYYNALVLTLCISSFDVHRVLVDPGSTANLLQLLAFNQMRFP